MRHTYISEQARKYHYWRGFMAASIVLGVPFAAFTLYVSHLISIIVK
jgi:hypothetical protein